MTDERLPELDALRGSAMVAVIGVHVTFSFLLAAPPASAGTAAALALQMSLAAGTPLFLALSMVGLTLGYSRQSPSSDQWTFLARRARRILPAYAFWTILTLLRADPAALTHPPTLARHLVTGSAAYHLYFVPLVCEYYLLWPLLAHLALAARQSDRAAVVIAGVGLLLMLGVWHAGSVGLLSTGILTFPLYWIGYATLGIASAAALARWLGRPRRERRLWLPLSAVTIVTGVVMVRHVRGVLGPTPDVPTLALGTTIFQKPILMYTLASMALATALVGGPARGTRLLQELGRASYGVYLSHVLVLEVVLHRIFGRPSAADFSSPAWLATVVVEWAACLALSFAVVHTMARLPGLRRVSGFGADRALTPPARAP